MPNVRHKREALTSAGVSFYLGASAAAPQPIPFRRSIKALLTIKPSKIPGYRRCGRLDWVACSMTSLRATRAAVPRGPKGERRLAA